MLKATLQRALLVCGGIILALITTEAAVYLGYWAVHGRRFPYEEYRSAMLERRKAPEERAAPAPGGGEWGKLAIHPYLGFVPDPNESKDHTTVGDPSQILARSDSSDVVGVFGGSFAAGVCAYGGAELSRGLERPGKGVRLVCAAAGGYKQPQSFLALAFLLAQGAHFDRVIVVDGFNEITLPPLDNHPLGVAPIYPRAWYWLLGNVTDPQALKLLGALSVLDQERRDWADLFARWRFDRSAVLALLMERWDQRSSSRRDALQRKLLDQKTQQKKSYTSMGPAMKFPNDNSLDRYDARIWSLSSLQMKLLCDANGIAYDHFLQPNQFVPNSKPLSPEEQRLVEHPTAYAAAVLRAYPLLRRQGILLHRSGVRFHDLTGVFKDVPETLYNDGCCHVNGAGYIRIAQAIGAAIRGGGE